MQFESFIARRIAFHSNRRFSRLIVRLAISAIALSVAVMILSISVVIGFKREIRAKVMGFDAPIQISGEFLNRSFESAPIYDSALTRFTVTSFPFVEKIQTYATKPAILKASSDFEGVVLKGVEADYDMSFFRENLIRGTVPTYRSGEQDRGVLLSERLASRLQLDTGATAYLYFVQNPPLTKKVEVTGLFRTDIEEIDASFLLVDLEMIRQVNQWSDNQIGGYEVLLKSFDPAKLDEYNDAIRFSIALDLNSTTIVQRYPQIFDWLGLLDKNVEIIIALMCVVAIINMITALLIMILERTQMIGLLKALGANNQSMRRIFVLNAAYFIFFGLLIGNLIGLGLIGLQSQFDIMSLPSDYYITEVPVAFTWGYFGMINLGTFLVCTAAMFLPSLMVTRIIPVKALRFS